MERTGDIISLWNDKSPHIVTSRIKDAREYKGLTLDGLAEKVGITKQAISLYEKGKRVPSIEILKKISLATDFPINFFYKEKRENVVQIKPDFRSNKIGATQERILEKRAECIIENVMDYISEYVRLPRVTMLPIKCDVNEAFNQEEIIEIVKSLRNLWKLSDKPIPDLAYIMQKNGCVIIMLDLMDKTDGFSYWYEDVPYIFLNSTYKSASRARFTLAHELGHLILHREDSLKRRNIKLKEAEANFFASEFLYPSEVALDELDSISLESLIPIKSKWGISIGALVRKALDLDLITDERYTQLNKQISKRRWRKEEPLDDILVFKKPKLLKDAFNVLVDNDVLTKKEILDEIGFHAEELCKICCLDKDYFAEEKNFFDGKEYIKTNVIKFPR